MMMMMMMMNSASHSITPITVPPIALFSNQVYNNWILANLMLGGNPAMD